MQDQAHKVPRPYLSRVETNERLEDLGFEVEGFGVDGISLKDSKEGRKMFQALQELIAGAIAEWVGVDFNDNTSEEVDQELQEWIQEWLVG